MLTIDELENVFKDFPVPALILTADKQYKILQVNEAYMHMLALLPENICGKSLFEVFPDQMPDDPYSPIKRAKRSINKVIHDNLPHTPGTIPYWLSEGMGKPKLRFWMPQYIPVVDESGAVAYVCQLTHEIKGNYTSIAQLPYESVFESAQNALFLSDSQGKVMAVNEAACTIFGYSEKELKSLGRLDVLEFDDKLKELLLKRDKEGRARGEVTGITKSGERFPCEYSSVKFTTHDGQRRNCTEIIDIRKWKNAEEKVRRSEENLRAIFDHTIEGFVLVNTNLEIVAFNDKAGGIIFEHNTKKEVKEGANLVDYLPADRRDAFRQVAAHALSGYSVEYERDYTFNGDNTRWFSFAVNPVKEKERVTGLCISGRDITRQKKAELEVLSSEKRFRKMVEYNADAIAIFSSTGQITYVSPAAEHITGYTAQEVMHMDVFSIIHHDDLKKNNEVIAKMLTQPGVPVKASPIRLLHKSGGWRWIESTLTNLLDDPEIRGIIDNFRDVTERIDYLNAIEGQNAQLREIAWFQSHIVRAPLASIMGLTELLINDPSNEANAELLPMIKKSADELDLVIREILRKTDYLNQPKEE